MSIVENAHFRHFLSVQLIIVIILCCVRYVCQHSPPADGSPGENDSAGQTCNTNGAQSDVRHFGLTER